MTKSPAKPAPAKDAEKLKPATTFEASGAVVEPAIVDGVDMNHPAIDDNPRAASTPEMNQLDPNVPSALESQEDAVERNLKDQGA
jgi:hypothetical protein